MTVDHNQIDLLINWLNHFEPSLLQNEDDVETKFVIPFFQYLGYPDQCRHGKYPIDDYLSEKGKPGRPYEIDQVYFSIDTADKQNADTSLLIVEAKKPGENLERAFKQAKYYGNHLAPIFLVRTDGYRILIFKRHQYRSEEMVFDIPTSKLRDKLVATEVYNRLHFELVKQIKEQGADPLIHALYVDMMNVSKRYPDIQTQLTRGDFEPSTTQVGRRLIVIKPKVAITCELPIVFEEGNCRITFSNIMLRGLTCHLSHLDILRDLLIGLLTPPQWRTRCFLKTTEQSTFEAHLGQTTVILSEEEAQELCDVVDIVGQKYKTIMIEATNALETWNFEPIKIESIKGFHILSVKQWLWKWMKDFSNEFDYDKGSTDWHIFDSHHNTAIRVEPKESSAHVIIWPKVDDVFLPGDWVDLLYVNSITYLRLYRNTPEEMFFKDVGPKGVWTAAFTKEWIVQKFIRKVLSYYVEHSSFIQESNKRTIKKVISDFFPFYKQNPKLSEKQLNELIRESIEDYSIEENIPLLNISEPKQLAPYLHRIQSWLIFYEADNVPASMLRPYYAAFTELARYTNPETINIGYIQGKLGAVRLRQSRRQNNQKQIQDLSKYNNILKFLDQQVVRIREVDYEDQSDAELLSRVFIAIVEEGVIRFQQIQLNKAGSMSRVV